MRGEGQGGEVRRGEGVGEEKGGEGEGRRGKVKGGEGIEEKIIGMELNWEDGLSK